MGEGGRGALYGWVNSLSTCRLPVYVRLTHLQLDLTRLGEDARGGQQLVGVEDNLWCVLYDHIHLVQSAAILQTKRMWLTICTRLPVNKF